MAHRIRVGTKINKPREKNPVDGTYVIGRITKRASGDGFTYRIEARTERQRCFDRALTGVTVWDAATLQKALDAGTLSILDEA